MTVNSLSSIFSQSELSGCSLNKFSALANLKTIATRYVGWIAHSLSAQSLEFTASFMTRILTPLTPMFFPL
jgi:hypothetical protein